MSEKLAARYRILLSLYPATFLQRRGDELLTTLLDSASQEQHWPSSHEVVELFVGAMRARWHDATGRSSREVWMQGIEAGGFLLGLLALYPTLGRLGSSLWWLAGNDWKLEGAISAQLSHALLWLTGALVTLAVASTHSRTKRTIGVMALLALMFAHVLSPPLQRAFPTLTAANPLIAMLVFAVVLAQATRRFMAGRRLIEHRTVLSVTAFIFLCALVYVRWAVGYDVAIAIGRIAALLTMVFGVAWAMFDPRVAVALGTTIAGAVAVRLGNGGALNVLTVAIVCAVCLVSYMRVRHALRD